MTFLSGLALSEPRAFWAGQIPAVAAGGRLLLAAVDGARIVGPARLTFPPQPTAPHHAEPTKVLVARSWRPGLGRRSLAAADDASCEAGRTLLVLHAEAGSEGDRFYRAWGWNPVGIVSGFALATSGLRAGARISHEDLEPAR